MSTLLRRYCAIAPDTEEATICAAPVPTATADGMPEKMSSGVMQEAAADTEQSREKADGAPHAEKQKHVRGHLGDGQIDVHECRQNAVLRGSEKPVPLDLRS